MRVLALAIHAAVLSAALLDSTATGVASTRLLREGSTDTKLKCDFYHCRPRSLSATTADCRLWCNNDGDSGSDNCAKYCKCPSDAVEDGGVYCKGVCLATLRCAAGRRLREGDYCLIVPRVQSWDQQDTDRVCVLDPGVRQSLTLYDPRGRTLSIDDTNAVLKRRFDAIDGMKSELDTLVNASKEHHKTKMRTRKKAQAARSAKRRKKTAMHRHRYRLRRRIRYTNRRVTRMVHDMHQKITSWLASNYRCVLLPSFQTAEMVWLYEREEAADGTPQTCSDERAPPALDQTESLEDDADEPEMPTTRPRRRKRERVILSSTARAMLAQAQFKFKQLLARVGGRLVDCEEEYTSKTCSSCGAVNGTLGGDRVFQCPACRVRLDRDVNAALIKNREMLV